MEPSMGSGVPQRRERRLTSPAVITELLRSEGISPRHAFGQNFLIDGNVLRIIVQAAGLEPFDTVVEVGPGLGALTQALVEQSGRVYAIESDPRLHELLVRELDKATNLVAIQADAMAVDLEVIWAGNPPEEAKMVSNLPYQIAATLLVDWLRDYEWLREYTVMVQREVAERIAAAAGGKDYSSATVKIQYRATVTKVASVSRNSFYPPPRVDSSILHLVRRGEGEGRGVPEARDEAFFDRLVTAAFHQRRKKIVNSVRSRIPDISARQIVMALAELGVKDSARAEELTTSEFAELSNLMSDKT